MPWPAYENIGVKVDGEYRQLNDRLLQIENEYYSTVRPKQIAHAGEKPTLALKRRGVRYIEIRSLDLNPYDPTGMSASQLRFVEAFALYCLAALVPKPRVNLTRFHGVFAPNSKYRVEVTPAKRGKGRAQKENEDKTPEQRHQAMTWAQRLKRVFSQGDRQHRGSGGHRQDTGSPHEERRITATTRVVASNAGVARFRLVGIVLSFTLLYTVQQQKERLPGGLLPEPSRKARKAVEEGGFRRKSRGLNRKRQEGRIFQAYPGSGCLP